MNNFVLEYFLFVYFSHILYMHENFQDLLFVVKSQSIFSFFCDWELFDWFYNFFKKSIDLIINIKSNK